MYASKEFDTCNYIYFLDKEFTFEHIFAMTVMIQCKTL